MKGKIFLCFVLILSLFSTCVYAQAEEDMSLFEIDRLIRKTEYDEALRQLNIYIKNKPDNFDNAQIRIRRIMNARKQYSILAEKLIDLIETDPGNNKEIYEITAQLEKFEKHPSDQNLQFIADLKKSAEFNYFRAQFLDIQTQSAKLTDEGSYVAAIEKTKEGFWLYKDDFYEKWEEHPEIISEVDSVFNDLNNQLAAFEEKNYLPKFNDAVNDFIKAVNQDDYELAVAKFWAVQSYFQSYNKIRQNIIDDGQKMQNTFAQLKNLDSDLTDASYLPFMFRFVYGVDSIENSGILGSIDTQWNKLAGQMNQAVYAVLSKNYSTYQVQIDGAYTDTISKYVSLEQSVLDLYKIPAGTVDESHSLENPYADYYVLTDYVNALSREALRITNIWNQIQNTQNSQNAILAQIKTDSGAQSRASAVRQLFNSNAELGNLVGVRSEQELESYDWAQEYEKLANEDWNGLSQKYSQLLDDIFSASSQILTNAWTEITQYYTSSSDALYSSDFAYYQAAETYNKGFFTKIPQNVLEILNQDISKATDYEDTFNADPEMDFGINYTYPDLSVKISDYVNSCVDKHIKELNDYETDINSSFNSHQQWKEEKTLEYLVVNANDYLEAQKSKLNDLKGQSTAVAAVARNKMVASELAKNEADIRYREAENALRSEDFDTARKKLQDALTKYDEALNNQNDETLRSDVDAKLQSLGERIAKGENEIVVREVRELKTLAKDAYFNGRFDDAEKYLNQAKTRWAVTNVTEDEEITNLLNFVNTAISMKTGRDILPSAPQYPEMSQLINLAYQYFDEGSRKIGEGQKEEGLKDLDLALDSIQKVQYVYPLNQEAAILTLRINRLKDPQKFQSEFAQKIETAKIMCENASTRQEGYSNLLDYYELDPDYKGLKDLIYQVEIDIGIRQKPVDNSGANRAKKLITDAQNIYKKAGDDTAKLQSALEKIDQALALVSDNKTAIALKDEITTKIGGTTSTVLSTEDERLYQLAIQRLQNNNVVGANAIVEQLLKKQSNVNSQKIKDLKNKIEARS